MSGGSGDGKAGEGSDVGVEPLGEPFCSPPAKEYCL